MKKAHLTTSLCTAYTAFTLLVISLFPCNMNPGKNIVLSDEDTVSSDECFIFKNKRKPDPFFFDDKDDEVD